MYIPKPNRRPEYYAGDRDNLYCVPRHRRALRCATAPLLAAALVLSGAWPALAQAGPPPRVIYAVDKHPYVLWRDFWIGGEYLAASRSVYSGSTTALTGDIDRPGWRLRTIAGYGQYTYRKWLLEPDGRTFARLTGRQYFSANRPATIPMTPVCQPRPAKTKAGSSTGSNASTACF